MTGLNFVKLLPTSHSLRKLQDRSSTFIFAFQTLLCMVKQRWNVDCYCHGDDLTTGDLQVVGAFSSTGRAGFLTLRH